MAITILQEPTTYTSGYNPNLFVVSASNSGSYTTDPFRYICQINVNGSTVFEFALLKRPNGNCLFDAQRTVENYLSANIQAIKNQTYGFVDNASGVYVKYQMVFKSEVMLGGGIWTPLDTVSSLDYWAINSALPYSEWVSDNLNSHKISATGTKEFLTNQPDNILIREGDTHELSMMTDTNNACKRLVIKTYLENGTLQNTGTINNPYNTISGNSGRFLSILVGPNDINNSTLTTGTNPLINGSTSYYEVWIENSSNARRSTVKRFTIDRTCLRDDKYFRLFWLNNYGRFDSINFTQVADKSIEVEQSLFNKVLGTEDSNSYTFGVDEHEKLPFFTEVQTSYKLRSGFIDTDTAEYLTSLYSSPYVYMMIDGVLTAIVIKDKSYTVKKTIQEKLINIELNVGLSVAHQRQRV